LSVFRLPKFPRCAWPVRLRRLEVTKVVTNFYETIAIWSWRELKGFGKTPWFAICSYTIFAFCQRPMSAAEFLRMCRTLIVQTTMDSRMSMLVRHVNKCPGHKFYCMEGVTFSNKCSGHSFVFAVQILRYRDGTFSTRG
jgi:hypothetical protein